MTEQEQAKKCKYAIKVLNKVANGVNVPLATRILACQYTIEVLCHNPDTNGPEQRDKL